MKIGVYHSLWGGVNGGTRYSGSVAQTLAKHYPVELVHHCADFNQQAVAEAIELDFSRIQFRYVPRPARPQQAGGLLARYRRERDWCAEISQPYDLFINSSDGVPFFNHARSGVLISYFPSMLFEEFHGYGTVEWQRRNVLLRKLSGLYHRLEWQRRFDTYNLIFTVSRYSSKWLRTLWNREGIVVYPSIRNSFTPSPKEPLILSIGAFRETQIKKHDVLVQVFKSLCDAGLTGWKLALVGTLRQTEDNLAYVKRLQEQAAGYPISFHPNATAIELGALLERATILWHAMGHGVDPQTNPGLLEHFGIVAIEAMSAGCIPVVFNGGGLPESVTHGQNGFLWNTLEELSGYTLKVAQDEVLRTKLSQAAVVRARDFSHDKFEARVLEALAPVLKG
jgi:glycosyltransferase involved in cell wall biosynthesis